MTISKGFWLGRTEVTRGQWRAVMGADPPELCFKNAGQDAPVERVSWDDCQEFVEKLNARVGKKAYRLTTEAEWEYACRAGTATALYTGPLTIKGANNGPELDAIAWYGGNSGVSYEGGHDSSDWPEKRYKHKSAGTHPAGQKKPNAWGLYDMLGNVWEWCSDWYDSEYYGKSPSTDPAGPSSGSSRVLRGGSWNNYGVNCRSANRINYTINYTPGDRYIINGFRLARSSP